MRATMVVVVMGLTFLSAVRAADPKGLEKPQKVVVSSPLVTNIVVTQRYAGQILAHRHIVVRALSAGSLAAVPVKDGQAVKKGDVLFQVSPALYKARLDVELADVQLARIEVDNAKRLAEKKAVSQYEVKVFEAKLTRAQARAELAQAELDFTTIKAPFGGLLDRIETQAGTLVKEGDTLTTLSDTSVMWVYFPVGEARYLEYTARQGKPKDPSRLELADTRIELELADGTTFDQTAGNVVTVEATFQDATGTIPFRADFPNPDLRLRHRQTGTVLVRRTVKDATVIPQGAAFEVVDRRYVYVVDKDDVVQRREIVVQHELDEVFVIQKGLDVTDRIVLDGGRRLRDGEQVECEVRKPREVWDRPKTDRKN
jgi:membrane fusion protein (multidrug efflux system)